MNTERTNIGTGFWLPCILASIIGSGLGTGQATKTFHDGQILEVDGNVGMVRILTSL